MKGLNQFLKDDDDEDNLLENNQLFNTQNLNKKLQEIQNSQNDPSKLKSLNSFGGLIKPIDKQPAKKKIKAFNINNISFQPGQNQMPNPLQGLGVLNNKQFNVNDIIGKQETLNPNNFTSNPFNEEIEEYKSKAVKKNAINGNSNQNQDQPDNQKLSLKTNIQSSQKSDIQRVARNVQMPNSAQVSRQNSMENLNKSLEQEESEPVVKKKLTTNGGEPPKKRIIKKIIKKKNADGSEAVSEVKTIVVGGDGQRQEFNQAQLQQEELKQQQQLAVLSPPEIEQTQVVNLQNQFAEEPKKKVKKIIIRKKKLQQSNQEELKIDQTTMSSSFIQKEQIQFTSLNEKIEQQRQEEIRQQEEQIRQQKELNTRLLKEQQQKLEEERQRLKQLEELKIDEELKAKKLREEKEKKKREKMEEEEKAKQEQEELQEKLKQMKKQQKEIKKKQQEKQKWMDNQETISDQDEVESKHNISESSAKNKNEKEEGEEQGSEEEDENIEGEESEEEEDEEGDSEEDDNSRRQKLLQPQAPQYLALKVAICNPACYKAFIEGLLHGSNPKEIIMNPIPLSVGMLRFSIERHRSGFNRLHPSYYLFMEKQGGEKNKKTRTNEICLGKLRANPEGDQYILYDNGENFSKGSKFNQNQIRNEHGVFLFKYEPCNIGNIRKMVSILPSLIYTCIPDQNNPDLALAYGRDQNGNLVRMIQREWKPLKENDTLFEVFHKDGIRNVNYQIFVDNPPTWNPKTNTYVYDFKGRVSQPSIKNFQLIPELDGRKKQTLKDFVLQFGKTGKNDFIVDVQYPFSIFQAFGQALSSFDTD
ncbi:tubby-related protein 1 [Stylonychia lemnae]|uniref:Tubby-related protein 1 n=1 Tax=Stylonychia lemnae TaxID=5949 RepID=A0A078A7S6_STYLE|nr:tubby-related protein 1 [Stylonychia lemnae]|eukprot:CDW77632.1 tubby-related protein 1 [Stylonychia lemnae]